LVADYPNQVGKTLQSLATVLRASDSRWKILADTEDSPIDAFRPTMVEHLPISSTAARLLRLRLILGVTVKADILNVLLGVSGGATAPELAVATHYTVIAVRQAADDLVTAGVLRANKGRPVRYVMTPDGLSMFGIHGATWAPWHAFYAFAATLLDMQRNATQASPTPYLLSKFLRATTNKFLAGTALIDLPLRAPDYFVGATYAQECATDLVALTQWLSQHV
jgi:hypothetical protein